MAELNMEDLVTGLHSIYEFPHLNPTSDQSVDTVKNTLLPMFNALLARIANAWNNEANPANELEIVKDELYRSLLSKKELERFGLALKSLDCKRMLWFPKHACVVSYKQMDSLEVEFRLHGLESWKMNLGNVSKLPSETGNKLSGGVRRPHFAESQDMFSVSLGRLDSELLEMALSTFESVVSGAYVEGIKEVKKKSFAPEWIRACLELSILRVRCKDKTDLQIELRGGTTDVGRHTGRPPCSTSFHLFRQMLCIVLRHDKALAARIITGLHIYNLDRLLDNIETEPCSMTNLQVGFQVADRLALSTIELDRDQQVKDFCIDASAQVLEIYMERLHKVVAKRSGQLKQKFKLPETDVNEQRINEYIQAGTPPAYMLPKMNCDARKRAIESIGSVHDLPSAESCSFKYALQWSKSVARTATEDLLHLLSVLDRVFFLRAKDLESPRETDNDVLGVDGCTLLEKLVYMYAEVVEKLHSQCPALDLVRLRSHRLLVYWIAACFVHREACFEHKLMDSYGVGIRWQDLRVVTTGSLPAQEALSSVVLYLEWVESNQGKGKLFDLSDGQGCSTIGFAADYARADSEMFAVSNAEKNSAQTRLAKFQELVRNKKVKAGELRQKLRDLEAEYESTRDERNAAAAVQELNGYWGSRHEKELKRLRLKCKALKTDLYRKRSQLKSVLNPPSRMMNPLPANESERLAVIFFLRIPRLIELAGHFIFLAQRALFGVIPADLYPQFSSLKLPGEWLGVYGKGDNMAKKFLSPELKKVRLCQVGSVEYPELPSSVDNISDCSQYVRFPVGTSRLMHSALTENWFQAQMSESIKCYVPELVQYKDLSWAVGLPFDATMEQSTSRGNLHFTSRSASHDLSNEELEYFGNIRAFPRLQLRSVVEVLLNRSCLPLDHPDVHILLKHAAFQTGDLSVTEDTVTFAWHGDFLKAQDFTNVVQAAFDDIANEVEHTPKKQETLYIACEIAAFMAQRAPCLQDALHRFANISKRWALETSNAWNVEMANFRSPDQKYLMELRATESIRLVPGIVALARLEMNKGDGQSAEIFLWLLFRFENARLFGEDVSESLRQKVHDRHIRVLECATCLVQAIALLLRSEAGDAILSNALKAVIPELGSLHWKQIGEKPCFEAEKSGTHYLVNIQTGVVLVGGFPPCRLPQTIRSSALYTRTFGDRDFEVSFVNGGTGYRTIRQFNGYTYEFSFLGDEPRILETCNHGVNAGTSVELIDRSKPWASELPEELCQSYSHWYCEEKDVIVFRGVDFVDRSIYWVAFTEAAKTCQVPSSKSKASIDDVVQLGNSDLDVLVHVPETVAAILRRVEFPEFMLAFRECSSTKEQPTVRVELRRYRTSLRLEGKRLTSCEEVGLELASVQHLDWLPFFQNYLVMVPSSNPKSTDVSLFIPLSTVSSSTASVRLAIPRKKKTYNKSLQLIKYTWRKRTEDFSCSSVLGRLHLAAIYAHHASPLIEKKLKYTASEAAMDMLRTCHVRRGFSDEEFHCLENVVRAPPCSPIQALCCQLYKDSTFTAFLDTSRKPKEVGIESSLSDLAFAEAATELVYNENGSNLFNNFRNRLFRTGNKLEDTNIHMTAERQKQLCGVECLQGLRCAPKWKVMQGYTEMVETELKGLVNQVAPTESDTERPFSRASTREESKIEQDVFDDLDRSWQTFRSLPKHELSLPGHWQASFEKYLYETAEHIQALENHLEVVISQAPRKHFGRWRTYFAVNRVPTLRKADLLCMVNSSIDNRLSSFNPFLSERGKSGVVERVRVYYKLVVLQDKLKRIQTHLAKSSSSGITEEQRKLEIDSIKMEFLCTRTWEVREYPQWLAFEAENSLQIRPYQVEIALHLINNPNEVMQLNMGLGKTRVILPLLILHFTSQNAKNEQRTDIVRVHILRPLFSEVLEHFERTLLCSALQVPVFEMPFHRHVEIDARRTKALQEMLSQVHRERGLLLIQPSHRLSLQLKLVEVSIDAVSEGLTKEFNILLDRLGEDAQNILDESDAILSHREELIYTYGLPEVLPSLEIRATTMQALFRALTYPSVELKAFLNDSSLAVNAGSHSVPGSADLYRLVDPEKDEVTLKKRKALLENLVDHLVNSPVYEFIWLTGLTRKQIDSFKCIVLDPCEPAIANRLGLKEESRIWKQCLCLRGLLGCGVFAHCLELQYRVNYGIDEVHEGRKRIAVPYRAAGVPTERSEFSHPDVVVMLTHLSYYAKGLTKSQTNGAVQRLLQQPDSKQTDIYSSWLKPIPSAQVPVEISSAIKLDLNSKGQQKCIWKTFQYSMELINFWLTYCILPKDTPHFSKQIMQSGWNLCDSKLTVGFSGTNDTRMLLPTFVKQGLHPSKSIEATNARMLHNMITLSSVRRLKEAEDLPKWKVALNDTIEMGLDAIIDASALLAGAGNNENVARFVFDNPNFDKKRFRGIVFFQDGTKQNPNGFWQVLETSSGRISEKSRSPILDAESFIIFDDAHTRGTDMKMRAHAVAGLTLGPRLLKDKLIQSAGRLRKLEQGQTLVLLCPAEVAASIHRTQSKGKGTVSDATRFVPSPQHVLDWLIQNTVRFTEEGLIQSANQGIQYCDSKYHGKSIVPAPADLKTLYGVTLTTQTVKEMFSGLLEGQHVAEHAIAERTIALGGDSAIQAGNRIELCEREMSREKEKHQEQQIQAKKLEPFVEAFWDYSEVCDANDVHALADHVEVYKIDEALAQSLHLAKGIESIFSESKAIKPSQRIYATVNFITTLQSNYKKDITESFLRIARWGVQLGDGSIVVLSDREADGILASCWKKSKRVKKGVSARFWKRSWPSKVNGERRILAKNAFFSIRTTAWDPINSAETLATEASSTVEPKKRFTATLRVGRQLDFTDWSQVVFAIYNGKTIFPNTCHKKLLAQVLANNRARAALPAFLQLRGLLLSWTRSDLDRECRKYEALLLSDTKS